MTRQYIGWAMIFGPLVFILGAAAIGLVIISQDPLMTGLKVTALTGAVVGYAWLSHWLIFGGER